MVGFKSSIDRITVQNYKNKSTYANPFQNPAASIVCLDLPVSLRDSLDPLGFPENRENRDYLGFDSSVSTVCTF